VALASKEGEAFDLENMSDGQLQELLSAVKKAISERVEHRVADLQNLAREAGFDVQLLRSQASTAGQCGLFSRPVRGRTSESWPPNTEIRMTRRKPGRGGESRQNGSRRKSPREAPRRIFSLRKPKGFRLSPRYPD